MSTLRNGKDISKIKEGVGSARIGGKKTVTSQASAITLAPALATAGAGPKTKESASFIPNPDDDILDDTPMDIVQHNTEKKTLLAMRKDYKKTKCNYDKVCSHLQFISSCMTNGKIPKGLQIKVKCNALLKDHTKVNEKFENTKHRAEKDFTESLNDHYLATKYKLSEDIARLEALMDTELQEASPLEKETHNEMMIKTVENIQKQQLKLEERKKRKLEGLTQPPDKRRQVTRDETSKSNPRHKQPPKTARQRHGGQGPKPAKTPRGQSSEATGSSSNSTLQTSQSDMATLATLLQRIMPPSQFSMQQPPQLLPSIPVPPGRQQPTLFAPGASALHGQQPPLPVQYMQGFQ